MSPFGGTAAVPGGVGVTALRCWIVKCETPSAPKIGLSGESQAVNSRSPPAFSTRLAGTPICAVPSWVMRSITSMLDGQAQCTNGGRNPLPAFLADGEDDGADDQTPSDPEDAQSPAVAAE